MRTSIFLCAFLAAGLAKAGQEHLGPMMQTGAISSQPIGHYEFCKSSPGDCSLRSTSTEPVVLTEAGWKAVRDANTEVNHRVAPRTDEEHYGKAEFWTYPDDEGDCEDYALEKRRILMEKGIPASDLLLTVLRKPDGEGHAILTVRTDRGDYVLDNLSPDVKLWSDTQYTFLKRQSEKNSGQWVSIVPHDDLAVGSIR